MTAHLKDLAADWRETYSMNDDQVAALIRDDEIDILVDLAGHTGLNRMLTFARRPAAVPGSRFILKAKSLSDEATRIRYRALFESHGIAGERIETLGRIKEKGDHLGAYGRVDIALYTFP